MTDQPFRHDEGGRIDRSRGLSFSFDGRGYSGYSGDTLASALLANGVHLVGRSFKYHRPRGILASGAEEPNALVQIGRGGRGAPNLRATPVELYDGLSALSVNRWPSLHWDAMAERVRQRKAAVAAANSSTCSWMVSATWSGRRRGWRTVEC